MMVDPKIHSRWKHQWGDGRLVDASVTSSRPNGQGLRTGQQRGANVRA